MSKFVEVELTSGKVLQCNILAKTVTALVVRTEDNRYLLISRDVLTDPEKFKFKD